MNKTIATAAIVLAIGLTASVALFTSPNEPRPTGGNQIPQSGSAQESGETQQEECFVAAEYEVRGYSLRGIIENAQTVSLLLGYYDCHEVQREDIVAYDYAGNSSPVVKIVKAIPGDSFSLQESEGLWKILVNGETLKTAENKEYSLNQRKSTMLRLYEESYNGLIPEETYLILGNVATGSVDSTVFGLVHKDDIIGKVDMTA